MLTVCHHHVDAGDCRAVLAANRLERGTDGAGIMLALAEDGGIGIAFGDHHRPEVFGLEQPPARLGTRHAATLAADPERGGVAIAGGIGRRIDDPEAGQRHAGQVGRAGDLGRVAHEEGSGDLLVRQDPGGAQHTGIVRVGERDPLGIGRGAVAEAAHDGAPAAKP